MVGGGISSVVGRTHHIASSMDARFKYVAGVFSSNPEISRESCSLYGLDESKSYPNVEQLLTGEAGNFDALLVLTPQHRHYEEVMHALSCGVPVICEKALCNTLEEARRIASLLEGRKGYLAVTYNYTGYPMLREFREFLQAELLGELIEIRAEMPQEGFVKRDTQNLPIVPQAWRLIDQGLPTVSLDLGVHVYGVSEFLTGVFAEEVVATSRSAGNFNGVIDAVSALVKFKSGLQGHFWYGKTYLGYRNGLRVQVFGTKGSMKWVQSSPEILEYADQHGDVHILDRASIGITEAHKDRYQRFKVGHPAGYIEAFSNYYWDIYESLAHANSEASDTNVTTNSPYVFGIQESLRSLALLEAVNRSAESKQWEKVCDV